MKVRELERLSAQYLMPALPGYRRRGTLLYQHPVGCILRGFAFDRSGLARRSVAMWCFVQPLYVPSSHLWFDFGDRLRDSETNREWFDVPEAAPDAVMRALLNAMLRSGTSFLATYQTAADLAKWKGDLTNPNDAEAVTYSKVLAGDIDGARRGLSALAKLGKGEDAEARPWMTDIAGRAARVAAALDEDPMAAKTMLTGWCAETAAHLKLPPE